MSITKYEAGNFSSLAYVSNGGPAPSGWTKLLTSDEVSLGGDGYFGVAYVKVVAGEATDVVIAHRGTVPTDVDDLIADVQLALNHANNDQKDDAFQFLEAVENAYNQYVIDENLQQINFQDITTNVGHSLGGWLATHTANSMGSNGIAITFDSPASGLLSTNANITHFLNNAPASVINSAGGNRVGTVYRLEPDLTFSEEEPVGFLNHLKNIPVAFADVFLAVPGGLKEFADTMTGDITAPVTTIAASPFIAAQTVSAHSITKIIQHLDTAEIDLGSSDVSIEEYYYVGDYSNSEVVGGVLKYTWDIGFNQIAGVPIEDVADAIVSYIRNNPAFDSDNPVERLQVGGNSSEVFQASDTTDQFIMANDGNDTIGAGNATSHTISGGEGYDFIDYSLMEGSDFVNVDMLAANSYLNLTKNAIPSGEPKDIFVDIEGIKGTKNGDVILGSENSNELNGYLGNDELDGDLGSDTLVGGAGNDFLHGGEGFDWLKYEGDVAQGIDLTIDVSLSDTLEGFTGGVTEVINVEIEDTVNGGTTTSTVTGNDGFTGVDGIIATNYDDTITIDEDISGGQILSLYLGLGNNTINLSNDDDTTLNFYFNTTKLQNDSNGAFANSLAAGTLSIYGHGGNDDIYGSAFADTIVGGQGDDTLRGFGGGDTFIFSNIDGEDTIVGSDKNDKIFVDGGAVELKGTLTESYTTDWDYQLLLSNNEMAYFKWSGNSTIPGSSGDLEVDFDGTFYYDILIEDFSNGDFGLDIEGAAPGFENPIENDQNDPINPIFTTPGITWVAERTEAIGGNNVSVEGPSSGQVPYVSGPDRALDGDDDDGDGSWDLKTPGYGRDGRRSDDDEDTDGLVESDEDNDPYSPGASKGDPHLLTYDGLFYDFQNTGEFTLTQSTDTNPFTIQARMQEWDLGDAVGDKFSVNTAIATQVGDDTIGFYIDGSLSYDFEVAAQDDNPYNDQHPNLFINDSAYFMADYSVIFLGEDDGYLYRRGNEYTVVNNFGDTLRVEVHNTHLDMLSYAAAQRSAGTLEGLLGNYDGSTSNEYKLDDGTDLGSTISVETLYNTFGEDWRITQAESLFLYDDGQTTSSFDNPDFIPALKTLADFDPAVVAAAETAVETAGFDPNSDVFDAAVMDYIVMGEITYTASWQVLELNATVTPSTVTEFGDNLIEGTTASEVIYGTDENDHILAYDSNDTVYADDGDDIIIGGAGDDILYGQGGADRFVHYEGDGNDHIYGGQYNSQNVIFMYDANGNWLTQDDLQFIVGSRDLQIVNRNSGEILTIDNMFYTSGKTVASVNGIDITGGLVFGGTDSAEEIDGTAYNDTIEGGLGDDTIYGSYGDDTYIHHEGDGNDHIYSGEYNSNDVVLMYDSLGGLIAEEDLQFVVGSRDLMVINRNNNETLTIHDHFYTAGKKVASVNGIDVTGGMQIVGTSAGESIYGTEYNDTLEGGMGDDAIYGSFGDDTYIHHEGDGNDHIYSGEYNSNDVVLMYDSLGGLIAEEDLQFVVGSRDLMVINRNNNETLTIHDHFYTAGKKVASVNGIDVTGGMQIIGTSAGESIYGTEYNDTLEGAGGSDSIYGYSGHDVFIHRQGDGNDYLFNTGYNQTDEIFMYDDMDMQIAETNLVFSQSGNDMVVTHTATSETLILDNFFYSQGNTFGSLNGIDLDTVI
ncbi:hypothetical protein NBRC116494_17860 [Aurantivibrio plasticivorans]